jgi:guanine nucleotide-binding protein subunit alpha
MDSVQQFRAISELRIFADTPFLVFFNKYDLFPEKLKRVPLKGAFRNYEHFAATWNSVSGENSEIDTAIEYFKKTFTENFFGKSTIEFFTTCALDSESCKKVWSSISRSIIISSLAKSGLTLG